MRRQLPVHSPIPPGAIADALRHAVVDPDRGRRELTALLRSRYSASDVFLTRSGTGALRLALESLPGPADAPVALPAFGCYDLATAANGAGVPVTFYDLRPRTLQPDASSLTEAVDRDARAVVVVPLYGIPVDWDRIRDALDGRSVTVVEDAAQGHGALWKERPVGSVGDLSVLSFGRGKGWTGGVGGCLLRRPGAPQVAAPASGSGTRGAARSLAAAARAAAQWLLGRPGLYRLPASLPWLHLGETRYRDPRPATSIPAFAAALAARTAPHAEVEAERRRATARSLLDGLWDLRRSSREIRPVSPPERGRASYLRLPVLTERGTDGFPSEAAAEKLGVAPAYPETLPRLPQLARRVVDSSGPHPGARELVRRLITLPTHSRVSPDDRQAILRLLNSYSS